MIRKLNLYLLCALLFLWHPLLAQQEATIANTRVEAVGDEVHINYDIVGNSSLSYEVWVEILDREGEKIKARSFKGDVGLRVSGGRNKLVVWDPVEDRIFLDADIRIQVKANFILSDAEKEFSRGGLILQSALFPGLGLSRFKKKPHWIKGVAAYGSLGGSVAFNRMAGNNYDLYSEASDARDASNLLEMARKQQDISNGLAYTAIAIWVTDLIWTVMGTSEMKASFVAGFNPFASAPVLTFNYSF